MRTVFKYRLPEPFYSPATLHEGDESKVLLPEGWELLHVGVQGDGFYLWALVETDAPTVTEWFCVVGTGWEVKPELRHCGTIQQGPYVWHVFTT